MESYDAIKAEVFCVSHFNILCEKFFAGLNTERDMARQVICLFYCSGTKSHTVSLVVGVADVVNAVENFRKIKLCQRFSV